MAKKRIMRNFASQMKRVYIIYDSNVDKFARRIEDIWEKEGKTNVCGRLSIIADEEHKTLSSVERICSFLLANGADRDDSIVAIGGGVTSDICGLAAGIYKRGISVINVPTTFLAQVDAAFGGKNGVNLDSVKNALGLIRLPDAVCSYPEPLRTLSPAQFRSGLAEMLKTFIIFDRTAYGKAIEVFTKLQEAGYRGDILETELTEIFELGKEAAAYKEAIVREDLNDHGRRHLLNLGHTFAHAIEWYQSRNCIRHFSHGEAVAIGMVAAAKIAVYLGLSQEGFPLRLEDDFRHCGLPVELPCDVRNLLPAITKDKKIEGGEIDFVLPEDIGKVELRRFPMDEFSTVSTAALGIGK